MPLVAQRPTPGAPRPYRFPAFTRSRLDTGLTVIGCHTPGRPLGSATLLMQAGAFIEPPEVAGVAAIAARTLTEGTERFDGASFAEAVERLGAEVEGSAGWETVDVSARVPVARLEQALELVAEAALRPGFPAGEVERARQERINEIRQRDAQPMARAERGFLEAVYTPGSPYGRDRGGSIETVSSLDRDTVERYYRTYATPGSATLIVAGDLEGFALEAVAERLFGSWSAGEPARARPDVAEALTGTAVTVVDRPGSVQSNFILGHMGIARTAPDYLATELMAHALGGSFNSRINTRLREEKGYTYGARAAFLALRDPGPFRALAPVETSVTAEAIGEMLEVIRTVAVGGITEEELTEARDHEVGVFALRFETPEAIVDGIAEMVVYGLPDDYFDAFGPAMEAITVADAGAAARARLHPDRVAIVVVGDAGSVAGPLRDAGIGPVTVVSDPAPAKG